MVADSHIYGAGLMEINANWAFKLSFSLAFGICISCYGPNAKYNCCAIKQYNITIYYNGICIQISGSVSWGHKAKMDIFLKETIFGSHCRGPMSNKPGKSDFCKIITITLVFYAVQECISSNLKP